MSLRFLVVVTDSKTAELAVLGGYQPHIAFKMDRGRWWPRHHDGTMLIHACMLGWYLLVADKKRLSATPPSLETTVKDNASQDSLDFQASFGEPRPSWWPHVNRDEFQGVDEWHLVDELTSRDVEFQGVPPAAAAAAAATQDWR